MPALRPISCSSASSSSRLLLLLLHIPCWAAQWSAHTPEEEPEAAAGSRVAAASVPVYETGAAALGAAAAAAAAAAEAGKGPFGRGNLEALSSLFTTSGKEFNAKLTINKFVRKPYAADAAAAAERAAASACHPAVAAAAVAAAADADKC